MIVLVGFMGAGKTTVGRLLAGRVGLPFTDSDQAIEERAGRKIAEIFADEGEPAFRLLEHQVIADLLAGPDMVLALGGGAPEHPLTRNLMADVPVVYLRVDYTEAMSRIGGDRGRPMLARPNVTEIYQRRLTVFDEVATLTIPTDGRTPEDITLDILTRLG